MSTRIVRQNDVMPTHPRPDIKIILSVALLPILAVNLCFQLATTANLIPDCFVYVDGCTSISATGRYGTSYWVFKAMMLPQCVLLVLFWRALARYFADSGMRWIVNLTYVASAFLVIYVLALGSEGDIYRLMRRYGVFVFFLGTFIAQIAVTKRYARRFLPSAVFRLQVALLSIMLLFAIAEVPLGTFGLEDDRAENIIEWNFSLLMQCWFATWVGTLAVRNAVLPDQSEAGTTS
ncbi:MAG: hypothetical protein AAF270_07595 [Pseudomonadota bacterium]